MIVSRGRESSRRDRRTNDEPAARAGVVGCEERQLARTDDHPPVAVVVVDVVVSARSDTEAPP
jgi:hypothetical protein